MRWDLILYFIQLEYEHLTIIAVCRPPKATQGQQRKKSNSSVPALPIYRACRARRPCRFTHLVRPALHRHFIIISQGNAQVSCEFSESERASAWQSQRGDVAKCTKKSVQIIINMGSIADAEDKSNI